MLQLETASLLEQMGQREASRQRYALAEKLATNATEAEAARRGLERLR